MIVNQSKVFYIVEGRRTHGTKWNKGYRTLKAVWFATFNPDINCQSLCNEAITTKTMRWHPTTLRHCLVSKETMDLWVYYINAGSMLSLEEFSEGGAGASNRPQSRVYKILTQTRYTTVTKTNQVIDCDRFENTRKSHKDGHVGTTRAGIVFRARRRSRSRRKWDTTKTARGQRGYIVKSLSVASSSSTVLKPCKNLTEVFAYQPLCWHIIKPINTRFRKESYFIFTTYIKLWPQLRTI